MSDRYPIQIRWDSKTKRYIARSARYPELTAYGPSRNLAEKQMQAMIEERSTGVGK